MISTVKALSKYNDEVILTVKRKLFNEQIKDNPLRSKADVKAALVDILAPAMEVFGPAKTQRPLPDE